MTVPLKASPEACLQKPFLTHFEAICEEMSERKGLVRLLTKTR